MFSPYCRDFAVLLAWQVILSQQDSCNQPIKQHNAAKEKNMSKVEERLTELEIRFTHQALLIEELNEVVTDCNQSIARLEKENGRLREMVKSFAPEMSESPDE